VKLWEQMPTAAMPQMQRQQQFGWSQSAEH
jgi:hypothetical protein